MAEYLFLLFDDESWYDNLTPESWEDAMKLHNTFTDAVEAAGAKVLGSNALQRTTTATTLRKDWAAPEQAPVVSDGPFIETKEALGGYYLIEARDLDQAMALGAQCPTGALEIRPVMDTRGSAG